MYVCVCVKWSAMKSEENTSVGDYNFFPKVESDEIIEQVAHHQTILESTCNSLLIYYWKMFLKKKGVLDFI